MPTVPPGSSTATVSGGTAIDGVSLAPGGAGIIGHESQIYKLLSDINVSLLDLLARQPTGALNELTDSTLVRLGFLLSDIITEVITDTSGTSTNCSNFVATSGKKNYITGVAAFNTSNAACTVNFRDGSAGAVVYTLALPANSGPVILPNAGAPWFRNATSNTALAFDVSAGVTTVIISLTGFQA